MLASILNLPRRIKSASSPTTPTPVSSCAALGDPCNGPEEDGFVLVGESAIERSTVMPISMQNGGAVTIAPPPSYEQVTTSSMPGLPPIGGDPHRGPTMPRLFLDAYQQNTMQQRTSDVVAAANFIPTNNTTSTDGILNKSSNTNWAIEDVPFELSALLAQSRRPMSEYYVPELQAVDWRQYDYDFQYEANVKRDSELALERMEEEMEDEEEEENSSQEDLMSCWQ